VRKSRILYHAPARGSAQVLPLRKPKWSSGKLDAVEGNVIGIAADEVGKFRQARTFAWQRRRGRKAWRPKYMAVEFSRVWTSSAMSVRDEINLVSAKFCGTAGHLPRRENFGASGAKLAGPHLRRSQ